MKDFFLILRRFLPPYKKNLILNVLFNLLAAFLTLFSFALIVPILEMLFLGPPFTSSDQDLTEM